MAAALARISGEQLWPFMLNPGMPSNGFGEGQTVESYHIRNPFFTSFNGGSGAGEPGPFEPDYEFEKSMTGDGSGSGCSGRDNGDHFWF